MPLEGRPIPPAPLPLLAEPAGGEHEVGLSEQLGAAFRLDSISYNVVDWATREDPAGDPDPDFDLAEHLTAAELEQIGEFSDVRSLAQLEQRRKLIARRNEWLRALEDGPLHPFVASLLALAADPASYVGFGGGLVAAARGTSLLARTALATGVVGANVAAAEGVLQLVQPGRTNEESAAAILVGGLLGGGLALGTAGLGRLVSRAADTEEIVRSVSRALSETDDLPEVPGAPAVGAEVAGRAARERFDASSTPILGRSRTVQAARRAFGVALGDAPWLALSKVPGIRRLAWNLADTRLLTEEMLATGEALTMPLETTVQRRRHKLTLSITGALDEGYRAHLEAGGAMKRHEFNREVARAMLAGDRHADPAIQRAAERLRAEVFDPLLEDAVNLGLLDEGIKKTRESAYFPYFVDADKLRAVKLDKIRVLGQFFDKEIEKGRAAVQRIRELEEKVAEVKQRLADAKERAKALRRTKPPEGPTRRKPRPLTPEEEAERLEHTKAYADEFRRWRNFRDSAAKERQNLRELDRQLDEAIRAGDTAAADAIRRKIMDAYDRLRRARLEADRFAKRMSRRARKLRKFGGVAPRVEDRVLRELDAVQREFDIAESSLQIEKSRNAHWWELRDEIDSMWGDDIASDLIARWLGEKRGPPLFSPAVAKAGPLKHRTLRAPRELFEDVLDLDAARAAQRYAYHVAGDIEVKRKFGILDPELEHDVPSLFKDAREEIDRITEAVRAEKGDEAAARVRRELQLEYEVALDLLRRIRGVPQYHRHNMWLPAVRAGRILRGYTAVRLLGGVVLAAVADVGRVMNFVGARRVLGHLFRDMATGFSGFRALRQEAREAALAGYETMLSTRMLAMVDLDDPSLLYGSHTRMERALADRAFPKMFNLTGQNLWNDYWKTTTVYLALQDIRKIAAKHAAGKALSERERVLAAISGLREQDFVRIHELWQAHGTRDGALHLPRMEAWEDQELARLLEDALSKIADDAVLTPLQGDRPRWMTTEVGRTFGQLRSFMIASNAAITMRTAQMSARAPKRFVHLVLSMMAMGALSLVLRDLAFDGEVRKRSFRQWVIEGLDRSGLSGAISELDALAASVGLPGPLQLAAGGQFARFRNRTPTDVIAGPAFGTLNEVAKSLGAIAGAGVGAVAGPEAAKQIGVDNPDFSYYDLRQARRLLPLQNWFAISWALDLLERETAQTLRLKGAPKE